MVAVAIGGFFGAILRFWLSQWIHLKLHQQKFIATFFVNSVGSFFLGLFVSRVDFVLALQLIAIGFLGAFTTFSTFSFEVVQLLEARRVKTAFLYVSCSCVISILCAAIGYLL